MRFSTRAKELVHDYIVNFSPTSCFAGAVLGWALDSPTTSSFPPFVLGGCFVAEILTFAAWGWYVVFYARWSGR